LIATAQSKKMLDFAEWKKYKPKKRPTGLPVKVLQSAYNRSWFLFVVDLIFGQMYQNALYSVTEIRQRQYRMGSIISFVGQDIVSEMFQKSGFKQSFSLTY
jgi:hypothetical protein